MERVNTDVGLEEGVGGAREGVVEGEGQAEET